MGKRKDKLPKGTGLSSVHTLLLL